MGKFSCTRLLLLATVFLQVTTGLAVHGQTTDSALLTARLVRLEQQQAQLLAKVTQLEVKVGGQEVKVAGRGVKVGGREVKTRDGNVTGQGDLDTRLARLESRVTSLTIPRIEFRAEGLINLTPGFEEALIFPWAFLNHGNHYNSTTGKFKVPVTGTYCFLATLQGSGHLGGEVYVFLMIDRGLHLIVDTAFTTGGALASVALPTIMHVRKGQEVWIMSWGNNTFDDSNIYGHVFSGYLLSADTEN